jgi:hypothetical protein
VSPCRQMFDPSPADSPEASEFTGAPHKKQWETSRMYTKGKRELLAALLAAQCAWLCHPDLANQLCAKPSIESSPNHACYSQGQPMPLAEATRRRNHSCVRRPTNNTSTKRRLLCAALGALLSNCRDRKSTLPFVKRTSATSRANNRR